MLDLLSEVETLTLTLGVSGSFSVVVVVVVEDGATGLKGPKGTRTKGLVVLAKRPVEREVGRKGVVVGRGRVVVVVVLGVETGVGRVGMKGTGGGESMESLSTKSWKVCLLLVSFCKLMTVMSSAG